MKKQIRRGIRVSRYVFYKETLIDAKEHFWSFLGAFVGIGLITYFHSNTLNGYENLFLIGSFGASSVLVYGLIGSPLAQPRNLVGGHVVSALVGVTINLIFPDTLWIAAPLAVAFSIVLMQMTRTLHPPGGATALIAVIGSEKVKELGYMYVVSPVLTGSLILLVVALVFNNITSHRKYPSHRPFKRTLKSLGKKRFIRKRLGGI
ncbi:CBS-domain-containing membrane protein [Algoriphagus sp. 4150]|uniref:HPP family protein n=1 Tax=Algoriphagus sp. 4150 TaxID=2817756 RepID=UPI00285D260D|nr:HPP family protein [Algoriphagus sp. 4150]MDR7130879.1 CBS-domain-containing membrane protein [Algoriphagus sp. 4150]